MISMNILLIYTMTAIAYNGTPGPVVMLVTGTRISHSFRHTLFTILGANLGSITLMLLAIFALLGIIQINSNILNFLKFFGCIYLSYLSTKSMYLSVMVFLNKNNSKNIKIQHFKGGFRQGYTVGVSNPKDAIFFASFFPQFMNISSSATVSVIILGFIWVLFDWILLLLYAIIAKKVISSLFENIFIFVASLFIFGIAIFGLREVVIHFLT